VNYPPAIAGGFLPRTLKSLTSLLSECCTLGRFRGVHSSSCPAGYTRKTCTAHGCAHHSSSCPAGYTRKTCTAHGCAHHQGVPHLRVQRFYIRRRFHRDATGVQLHRIGVKANIFKNIPQFIPALSDGVFLRGQIKSSIYYAD